MLRDSQNAGKALDLVGERVFDLHGVEGPPEGAREPLPVGGLAVEVLEVLGIIWGKGSNEKGRNIRKGRGRRGKAGKEWANYVTTVCLEKLRPEFESSI